MDPLTRHQREIERNFKAWQKKPLLREIYRGFYEKLGHLLNPDLSGVQVEIGSGIGSLETFLPQVIGCDLFPNPWVDVVCDGYEMPFADGSVSHLILFDVFHHLEAPRAFLNEAGRVLIKKGRIILCEPFISWFSRAVYGLAHDEPIGWTKPIVTTGQAPRRRGYYAAQGNATRVFFRRDPFELIEGWQLIHAEVLSGISYLASGGFSRRAFYSEKRLALVRKLDQWLSRWPRVWGARCLVVLEKIQKP